MSEENIKTPAEEGGEGGISASQAEPIELIVDKRTGEITFRSKDGQVVTAKATILGGDEDKDKGESVVTAPETQPLTPEQFREALQRLNDIGLMWTAEGKIRPREKDDSSLLGSEFKQLRKDYPSLPREVNSVAFHYLIGTAPPAKIVGDEDAYKKKVDIAKEFYLNEEYRAGFFFKHAIKVPYFSEIDWEIVIKTYEKNVNPFAGVAYALLSLHLNSPESKRGNQIITVAVNAKMVDELMATLGEIKKALDDSQRLTRTLRNLEEKEGSGKIKDADSGDSAPAEKVG